MTGELTVGVRRAAMDLLARREHSVRELHDKLSRRFEDCEEVRQVVEQLQQENLLSDSRFAESFVHFRALRGHGPLRIAAELRHRGVAESICNEVLDGGAEHWVEHARAARRKRFGNGPAADRSERGRQSRFLERRGFTRAQIRTALAQQHERQPA